MRTDLSVYLFPGDFGGCGFYRMTEPARVVSQYGVQTAVTTEIPVSGYMGEDGAFEIENIEFDADVMILQRPMLRAMLDLIEACQDRGIACIVELDDDLMATHKNNVAYKALNPKTNSVSNWNWLKACCDKADLVSVSTPNLAKRYAPHGRFRVLRNCVPELELKRDKVPAEDLRLGWSGTVQTHPEDLMVVGGQINAALNGSTGDPGFYVVGDGEGVPRALSLSDRNPVYATGWVPRDEYFANINSHIDVGIVPLTIDTFNTSKSYLKSLEFASQGIPSVVSATEENVYLSRITGNPVVNKTKDWQRYLKPLLSNKDFWLERSAAVREAVTPLTYENHAENWIVAWNHAVENRAGRKFF